MLDSDTFGYTSGVKLKYTAGGGEVPVNCLLVAGTAGQSLTHVGYTEYCKYNSRRSFVIVCGWTSSQGNNPHPPDV